MYDKALEKDNALIWSVVNRIKFPESTERDDLYQESILLYIKAVNKLGKTENKTKKENAYIKKIIFNGLIEYLNKNNIFIEKVESNLNGKIKVPDEMYDLSELQFFIMEQRFFMKSPTSFFNIGKSVNLSRTKIKKEYDKALLFLQAI